MEKKGFYYRPYQAQFQSYRDRGPYKMERECMNGNNRSAVVICCAAVAVPYTAASIWLGGIGHACRQTHGAALMQSLTRGRGSAVCDVRGGAFLPLDPRPRSAVLPEVLKKWSSQYSVFSAQNVAHVTRCWQNLHQDTAERTSWVSPLRCG